MHITYITVGNTERRTGGYRYHARVWEGLRERGVSVTEIVASGATVAEQAVAADSLGARVPLDRSDVVIADVLARAACAPWIEGWRAARPLVGMVHELPSVAAPDSPTAPRDRMWEAHLLRRADRLITVSADGKAILEARGVPAARIAVVPPGCDRLPPGEHAGRSRARSAECVHALCVAQWIPRKGIVTLVEAWARHARPGAILELIGEMDADPAYTAAVRAALVAAPAGSVVVSGAVDDAALAAAYRRADLFVLPSRYEGYGMVYAEALASGLPVIACAVGPVPDLVGAGAGLFVPPDDVDALAAALDELLGDAARRTAFAAGAWERAHALPRWDDTIDGFLRAVRDTIRARQGARARP